MSDAGRADAMRLFEEELLAGRLAVSVDDVRLHLAGRPLGCSCRLDEACHADVLLRVANPGQQLDVIALDVVRPCAWCDQPAITKAESGMRACRQHAALDGVRSQQVADSKARMDAAEVEIVSKRAAAVAVRVGSMQPADVTAAPAEVVAEVLRDPATFLDAAASAAPGWSDRYGGPEGVAQLTIVLHDHLAELTKRNADLRTSTLIYLRTQANLSLAKLGELLGMSRQRVGVASRRADDGAEQAARPFAHLESRDGWNT